MHTIARTLAAAVVAVLALLGLWAVSASATVIRPTVLTFHTAAPGLGYTAGAVYVPGVTSKRIRDRLVTPDADAEARRADLRAKRDARPADDDLRAVMDYVLGD